MSRWWDDRHDSPKFGAIIFDAVVAVIVLTFVLGCWGTVPAGHRGVLMQFSAVQPGVKGEGLYFKLPLIQGVQDIEVRVRKNETKASASSKDLQQVSSYIALNYHLNPETVNDVWQDVGPAFESRLINPAVQEIFKATTARYAAEELITKRPQVSDDIKIGLEERLAPSFIIDEFNIIDFDFSKSFNDAIEAKVTAEQKKLQAENDLLRIEVEAKQITTTAAAKAEAIRIEGQAIAKSKDVVQLRWIEKWDGKVPTFWGEASPFIGVNK